MYLAVGSEQMIERCLLVVMVVVLEMPKNREVIGPEKAACSIWEREGKSVGVAGEIVKSRGGGDILSMLREVNEN
jgi:hypothetical protein